MIISYKGIKPNASKAAFVAENAVVAGNVTLEAGSSIWFCAVVRAEEESVAVGEYSNVQDNCTLHSSKGFPVKIGSNVTIGHNAVVHGCTVGDGSLIGMNATILNGAKIGKNCLVGAGALVTENKSFPDNTLILGVPARAVGTIDEEAARQIAENAQAYLKKANEYGSLGIQAKPL